MPLDAAGDAAKRLRVGVAQGHQPLALEDESDLGGVRSASYTLAEASISRGCLARKRQPPKHGRPIPDGPVELTSGRGVPKSARALWASSGERMSTLLDFEKPILELEGKVKELRSLAAGSEIDISEEVARLEGRASKLLSQTYAKLNAWQKTQVARHADRPHFKDYSEALIQDFAPLAGDRLYAEDRAIVGGLGRFRGLSVMVIGHEKGADTDDRVRHNFGMARPEGYRKAVRLMRLAERFRLPVLTFVDTPGAHPGVDAEERGQAEAIARAIEVCLSLEVPLVATVVGEGGSGGAIALAAADRILMLEHSIYSVISPEGCAAILWRSADQAPVAAEALRLTAQDLLGHRLVDLVIQEPMGGAHRGRATTIAAVGDAIEGQLRPLLRLSPAELKRSRRDKFLRMGQPTEPKAAPA